MVTSIGSLPHRDADAAAAFVLRHQPELPAAPQLPRRSPLEGMVAQAARGIPGVSISPDGTLSIVDGGIDPSAPVQTPFDGASHAGLLAFLSLAAGRTDPVKLQLTGPITLGLALLDAGVPLDQAFEVASAAGATVLSLPVDRDSVLASAAAINIHLERGGWIAWGAVPTNEPLGTDADRLWRRLSAVWCDLVQSGCDPIQLRQQAMVTPACGLAGHGPSQAARALKLAQTIAARVTDQASAIRLSAGA